MHIRVSNRIFDSEEIIEIRLNEDIKEVFVTTTEDFFRVRYRTDADIADVRLWEKLHNLTFRDINNAVYTLFIVCDYFINTKEQCSECPLKKHIKCIFSDIPINWRT